MMFKIPLRLLLPLLLVLAGPATADAQLLNTQQAVDSDRTMIPGHYTVGLYADARGSSTTLELPEGQDTFDVWLGITGDSTHEYGSVVMRLELPYGLDIAGPFVWFPREDLKETGDILDKGMVLEFTHECIRQTGSTPAILGRLPFRMQPGVNEATLTPEAHKRFGLSVELCADDGTWPKPYADPVSLTVKRHRNLWQRLTGWFN